MLYLVTGGSGSGKSEYAEALVQRLRGKSGQEVSDEEKQGSGGGVWYLATMIPYGAETEKKDRPSPKDAERQRFCDKRMLSGSERICARGRKERKQTIRRSAGMYGESDSQ